MRWSTCVGRREWVSGPLRGQGRAWHGCCPRMHACVHVLMCGLGLLWARGAGRYPLGVPGPGAGGRGGEGKGGGQGSWGVGRGWGVGGRLVSPWTHHPPRIAPHPSLPAPPCWPASALTPTGPACRKGLHAHLSRAALCHFAALDPSLPGSLPLWPPPWNAGQVGVRCSLEQMLEEGFYHGDPHPGQ